MGQLPPGPGPVEADKSSLCIVDFHYSKDLFSLDAVVLIIVICHFQGREIGWSTVCANGKQNEAKPPIEIGVCHLHGSILVVFLVKEMSLVFIFAVQYSYR